VRTFFWFCLYGAEAHPGERARIKVMRVGGSFLGPLYVSFW
jgi:hypothetical protein